MKDAVIKLWLEGWSSGAIALELGLTRNKVMGHVWRAQNKGEIAKRKEPPKKALKPKRPEPKVKAVSLALKPVPIQPTLKLVEPVVKPVVPPPKPPPKTNKPKTIMELGTFDCRYILEDGRYCGRFAPNYRQPWCDEHRQLVYAPVKKKA